MTPPLQLSPDVCARRLGLLADPTRLAVVGLLMGGPLNVGQINKHLGIDQSLLSHHLRVLRDGGLVNSQRDGKANVYRVSAEARVKRHGDVLDLGCCQLSFRANV